jgi:poly-gamma-glutamate biosynthesis protein PgsC/CapC
MIIEALFVGLVAGFLFYELWGLSPGGVIAPGYLALFVGEPGRIVSTLILALALWGLLELLSRRLILYGRRRLLLALLLGFCGKVLIERWLLPGAGIAVDLQTIGYLIPGLIANEMVRQKPLPTLAALVIVTTVVAMGMVLRYGTV